MIIAVFFISVFYVFCKAFQQRNVTLDKKKTILPMSILMGLCEYTGFGIVSVTAVNEGILSASFLGIIAGLGGCVGCIGAIELHKKLHNNK